MIACLEIMRRKNVTYGFSHRRKIPLDPGSFLKEPLNFAALEANPLTLPHNSADKTVIDSFQLEKYLYREKNRKFRDWHALDLTPSGCHLKTYDKALTKCNLP